LFMKMLSLLKQSLFLLLFLLILGQPLNAQAQTTVSAIENLAVDIWPDYDRPSVLVILTGVLPASAALPATVTIPLPDGAELTAMARITADNELIDDIDFNEGDQAVTLTTPEPRFRVEYYMPYALAGEERTFTFEWQAAVAVGEMRVSVQQPVGAEEMTTDPAVFSVLPREDGFQYHNLSPQAVAAGERLTLAIRYSRSVSQLSAELRQPETTTETIPTSQPETASGIRLTWPTILLASGGVAVLAVGLWTLFGERMMAARRRPGTARPIKSEPELELETAEAASAPTFVQFCHQCGQKSDSNDRFCRSCGTRLKT
jgi:hypothetical protein